MRIDIATRDLWIFGYGSLIWRPDFPFAERRIGYVFGWARRFYQGSPDHRGTPALPGRVVTLVPMEGHCCWGAAYRIEPRSVSAVLERLDYREQGGYRRIELSFFQKDSPDRSRKIRAMTYIADQDNPHYLGPAPQVRIAAHILNAKGPSGANLDYLFRLETALTEMGTADAHVFGIARSVREQMRGTSRTAAPASNNRLSDD